MRTAMKTFDNLQNIWNQQSEPNLTYTAEDFIKKADTQIQKIKRNHIWTIVIISLTSILLIFYYIWINSFELSWFSLGIGIMISMLVFRIILEWISINKFNAIRSDLSLIDYSKQVHQFYNWRKKIHLILTPIIYLSYSSGFIILLPTFKANLSTGLYYYILISGFIFLVLFGIFMANKIKKELKIITYLKNISQ